MTVGSPSRAILRRSSALVVGALSLAVMAGACGSSTKSSAPKVTTGSNGSSSNCVSKVTAALAPYRTLPTRLPPQYTSLSKPPKSGGFMIYIDNTNVADGLDIGQNFVQAAKIIGWKAQLLNENSTPADVNAKFSEAITEKPNFIALLGIPVGVVSQPLAAAKAAGIPVVMFAEGSDLPTSTVGYAASVEGQPLFDLFGKLMAEWVAENSNCQGHAAFITAPYNILTGEQTAFLQTMKSTCRSCVARSVAIPLSDLGTPAETASILSAVQADTKIKWLVFPFASISDGVLPTLQQAGFSGIKLVGAAPDVNTLKGLQDGSSSLMVATTDAFAGWAMVDAGLRVLDTGKPVLGSYYPVALVSSENVPKSATTVDQITYPTDFKQEFTKLWTGS